MMSKDEFLAKWSQLHSGSPVTGIVGAWLSISYRFGLIATLLRITPNALTLLGLLAAVATAYWALSLWAIALLVFSLFCDGIDGSVAIFQKKESARGAIFDSVADRISEAMWLVALYRIGVPAWITILLWVIASVQEYARARLSSLGVAEIGVVTPVERPVRASFIFIALVMWNANISGVTYLSIAYLVLQAISVYLVVRFARSQLH
jgi:CDP-diacylglycerol--glycerol-3-phosphate 3-phosphatidyltransferase